MKETNWQYIQKSHPLFSPAKHARGQILDT